MAKVKAVYKYQLPVSGNMELPVGAEILSVNVQKGYPRVWALIDPTEKRRQKVQFLSVETGQVVHNDRRLNKKHFLGTVMFFNGEYVVHVFKPLKR